MADLTNFNQCRQLRFNRLQLLQLQTATATSHPELGFISE